MPLPAYVILLIIGALATIGSAVAAYKGRQAELRDRAQDRR